ncbi:MAG: hypothetical protein J5I59_13090 [Saprospiraceae bacterium]|nr:hypothetical protein [Saprospiraceae bacterium]
MNQTYTIPNNQISSKKIKNYSFAFVNETPDLPEFQLNLSQILPDVKFKPKKSTLEAILAYSSKK